MSRLFAANRPSVSKSVRRRKILLIEELEDRSLMSVYTPAQIRHAYGFDQIMFGGIKGDGTGQTIAIVDAYDAPKINQDLQKFDQQFGISNNDGLGDYALTKATPQGVPAYNAGWSQETALDVEWAHAIAPGAHILLVEAASNSFANLFGAVNYARSQPGVSAVSMSWGSGEFSTEALYDSYFTSPTGHGVSFIASSGDTGAVALYPAVSPNVLGVGGTSVQISSSGTWLSETGWSGSGGGISAYESKPAYQSSVTQSSTKRTSPDVAYDANPNTGVYVYWTNASTNVGGFYAFGGTSAGAPQWAALVAVANQGRTYNTDTTLQGSLDGRSQLLPAIYNLPSSDFHDETSGTAGSRRHSNTARTGYDLVTGRGSPLAQLVVQHLLTVTATGTLQSSGTPTAAPSGGGSGHLAEPTFFVVEIQVGMVATAERGNDAAFVGSVYASKLLPYGPQTVAFVATEAPSVLNPFDSRQTVTQPADTRRAERLSPTYLWVDENAEQGHVANDPYLEGTLVSSRLVASASHHLPFGETMERGAATDALPAPTLLGNGDTEAAPGANPAHIRIDPAQPEERGTLGNVVTKAFVNVIALAGAVAFFAHGALVGRSRIATLRQEENERESA